MLEELKDFPWEDIRSKGFLHVKGFIPESELSILRRDWSERAIVGGENGNYPIIDISQTVVWRFYRKMKFVCAAVRAASGINADADAGGSSYFSTGKGIDFCWHQDPESYFIYQQHFDYLNFYIPVLKPNPNLTNLCVVPFDRLEACMPDLLHKIVGSGAKRFFPQGDETIVYDDDDGSQFILPVNFEKLMVVPELSPGDLLLLRGDIIHRTQDTLTERVAASFRWTSSSAVISKAKFEGGCAKKKDMMQKNWPLYESLLACLHELKQEQITAGQFHSYVMRKGTGA